MVGDTRRLALGVVRETVLAFVTWVLAATGLYVAFRLAHETMREQMVRQNPSAPSAQIDERIYEFFPIDRGPRIAEWFDWVVSYSTFDLGHSISQSAPVVEVFAAAFGASLVLVLAICVAAVVVGVPLLWVTARLGDDAAGLVFTAPAYVFATMGPLVTGLGLLTVASHVGVVPARLTDAQAEGAVPNVGLLLLVGVAVATPVVADAVRRIHRTRVHEDVGGLAAALRRGSGGLGTVELSLYGVYVASSSLVIEDLFALQGVGFYLYQAVVRFDVPLFLGLTGAVVFLLVFLAYVRNVGWVVARYVRTDDRESVGESIAPGPDPRTVLVTLASNVKVVVGSVVLGGAFLFGLVGSLLLAPETPFPQQGADAIGIGPGQLTNTVGSLLVVALVAGVVALALGALFGLLAGVLEGSDRHGTGAVATLVRVPSELWLLGPPAIVVAAWGLVLGVGDSRTSVELTLGVASGLVLAGYCFRATYEAARVRVRDHGPTAGAALSSLVAGLARVDGVVVVLLFVVGEVVFLGLVPTGVAPAFTQLDVAVSQQSLVLRRPGQFAVLLGQAAVTLGIPALGVALVGDGLGEATAELRSEESVDVDAASQEQVARPDATVGGDGA